MTQPQHPVSLAGSHLGAVRLVCAFFMGDDEESRVLLPFIREGLSCGDYARVRLDSFTIPIDALKIAQHSRTTYSNEEIRQTLNHLFGDDPEQWPEKLLCHHATKLVSNNI